MPDQVMRLRGAWSGIPRRAQLSILIVTALTIAILFVVVRAATSTEWVPVTDKLGQGKVAEARAALDKEGIRSQIGALGTLEVPKEQANQAGATLADAGIAGAGSHTTVACRGSNASSFIANTSAQQAQQDRVCLENQLANMIEAVGSIQGAKVALTLPQNELFTNEETDAKASVTVDTGGSRLSDAHVRAINMLVTNGVKGMQPENVGIVDDSGHPYSSEDGEGGIDSAQLKLRVENTYNMNLEAKLTAKFEEMAGVGKVKVISNAELDMDAIDREVKDVGGEENVQGPKVAEKYDTEILNRAEEPVAGAAGTATNVTGEEGEVAGAVHDDNGGTGDTDETGATERRLTVPVGGAAAGDADYVKDSAGTTYSNDEVREAIKVAPGKVLRNRLSIVVDTSVPAETANAIKNSAETQLGGNPEDSFNLEQARIAQLDEQRATTARFEAVGGYVKWALLGLGLVGMAFFLRRTLNQRTQELLYPMDDLLALEPGFEPIPLRELEAAVAAASSLDSQKRMELERKVGSIASDKPQEVAQMLRGWLHDADGSGRRSA